ncbi:uncharacterized [Tachysurus ichikawai]
MEQWRARGWESPSRSPESVAITLIHTVIGSLRYTPARSYFSGDTTAASRPSYLNPNIRNTREGNLKPRVLFKGLRQALCEISQVKPLCWEWVI